jgi:Tfp pilus assembly protein PilO
VGANNKKLFGAILVSAALFAFWIFVYPKFGDISAVRQAITERQALVTQRQDLSDRIKKLTDEYRSRATEIATFSAVLPAKKSIPEIIQTLQNVTSAAGAQVSDMSVSEVANTSGAALPVNKIQIAITARGTYAMLKNVLDGLEKSIRLLDVTNIEAVLVPGQSGTLSFTIKASGYYLK